MSDPILRGIDTSVPVVVAYHGGNGALAIARTLGRLGVPMYLIARKNASPTVQSSRYWRKRFWWDFSAPPDESLEFLLGVGSEIGGRPLLLTLADWVAIFIEQHADALAPRFVFPRAREPVIGRLADKWSMFALARACGVDVPETVLPHSRDDVLRFAATASFPIVAKTADPFLPYVPEKAIVRTERELIEKFEADTRGGGPNLILQEYIPGGASSVWMCNAYFSADSQCKAIFTGRKLRQVSETGVASLAVCEENERVAEATRKLMQGVGYAGAVGIGYRYDARDDRYKVLDVNPRVSGVFRLFRATNGMDVVRACYLDLTGQPVPASALSAGRKWMLEDDVFAARAQGVRFFEWLRTIRGVRELQWFAADDPAPGLRWMWTQFGVRAASKVMRSLPKGRRTARSARARAL